MIAGLFGTVVEIGFDSGLNMYAYPVGVTLVYAVERVEGTQIYLHLALPFD